MLVLSNTKMHISKTVAPDRLIPHTWQNTNELNITVLRTSVASDPLNFSSRSPSKLRTPRTASWYILWPIIFLHMAMVIKLTPLPTGGLFKRPSFGGSVANASAPRVSIIMFTQSNWTAVRGADPESDVKNWKLICHCPN